MIKENDDYLLERPYHCRDMNYHLIDKETGWDYLIDIGDVLGDDEDASIYPEQIFLSWETLRELSDMDEILEYSWKIVK